jgi:hypothetical protein
MPPFACRCELTSHRPARLSDWRAQLTTAGQVELKLKTTWRDGTTHLVMSQLEFMQRLAALVPRPRLHLIWFHRVLAPSAKPRVHPLPKGPPAHAPSPPPGCSRRAETLRSTWRAVPGDHLFSFRVDDNGLIPESEERNNWFDLGLRLLP